MTCRICDNREGNRAFTAREMMFGLRDQFTYFECVRCGCVQICDVPDDLNRYYPPTYYSYQSQGLVKAFLKPRWAAASYDGSSFIGRILTTLLGKDQAVASVARSQVSRAAAILDVGCGSGDLLLLLRSLGFTSLTGVDPFIGTDLDHDGVKIWKMTLGEITRSFDLIMLHHSFEHMSNPVEIMTHAHRLLKPSGTLIIRVPVAASYAWKKYGANWVQLDAPRHIFLPSVTSMQVLAERVGLQIGEMVHESNDFQFWGSEQYALDIPLLDAKSLAPMWKRVLARRRLRPLQARAEELNAQGEGDSVCFYLHRNTK